MTKSILIGCGVLALIAIFFLLSSQPATSPAPGEISVSSSTIEVASSSASGTTGTTTKSPTSKPAVKGLGGTTTGSNFVVTPAAGDKWVTGENHAIQWSQESLGTGSITLIDAQTGSLVGYIAPSLTLHQKSFSWNTRDVLITRGGNQRKTIQPGDYLIKVTFEVGNKPAITSGRFSLIYSSQQETASQALTIKNYVISPAKITVKKGDIIYISNNDTTSHKLMMSGFPSVTIPAGQTIQYQTNSLTAGYYEFYSDQYSGMKAGVTVQ